jgi:CheY-like chemotaxis protein
MEGPAATNEQPQVILVVEQEREIRDGLGRWLQRRGHEVLECPGPQAPTYACIGSDRSECPLARAASVILLDMWLAGEAALTGASSLDLLEFYLGSGVPVIAFIHGADPTRLFLDDRLTVMEWPPDRRELIETIDVLVSGRSPD